jgi:large subunit ribosomal protein L31e
MAEEIERIYIIPLKKKTKIKSSKAAPHAIKTVKKYLTKHMKVEEENIWIDDSLNESIWSHGKYTIPSKMRVKAVKFDDGVVEAYIPELEFKKSRRELLKEEKEKKEPILRKEEAEEEEETTGAEDFEVSPAADGEVKIKKKKTPKKKEEAKEKETEKKPKKTAKKEKEEKPKRKSKKKVEKTKTTKKPSSKTKAKKKSNKSK